MMESAPKHTLVVKLELALDRTGHVRQITVLAIIIVSKTVAVNAT